MNIYYEKAGIKLKQYRKNQVIGNSNAAAKLARAIATSRLPVISSNSDFDFS